jgi:YNFM family putative membrane transporter
MFYSDFGWIGVIVMIIVFTIIAIGLSVRLGTIAKRKLQLSSHKL